MTSNEIRQVVGIKPSDDPNADKLRNANLSQSNAEIEAENGGAEGGGYTEEELANMSDEDKEALAMLEKQYGE